MGLILWSVVNMWYRLAVLAVVLLLAAATSVAADDNCSDPFGDVYRFARLHGDYASDGRITEMAQLRRVVKGLSRDPTVVKRDWNIATSRLSWPQNQWTARIAAIGAPGDNPTPDGRYRRLPMRDCSYARPSEILESRVRQLGNDHPYVQEFIHNQALVFSNCNIEQNTITLPSLNGSYEPEVAALARQDVAYQRAATAFYAADDAAALAEFAAIGAEESSPHRAAAHFMIARTLLAAHRFAEGKAKIDQILADPRLSEVHAITAELLPIAASIWRDTDLTAMYLREISSLLDMSDRQLDNPVARRRFQMAMEDLPYLIQIPEIQRLPADFWLTDDLLPGHWRAAAVRMVAKESDWIDWLQAMASTHGELIRPWLHDTYRSGQPVARAAAYALERWRQGHGLEWAIPAFAGRRLAFRSVAPEDLSDLPLQILARLRNCRSDTAEAAAFSVLFYHHLRTSRSLAGVDSVIATGGWWARDSLLRTGIVRAAQVKVLVDFSDYQFKFEEARRLVAAVPPHDFDSRNLHLLLARDMAEFVDLLGDKWAGLSARSVLSLLPAVELDRLANVTKIHPELRAALARTAWTRAVLLDKQELLPRLTRTLRATNPRMGPDIASIEQASSPRARDLARIRLLLKQPRMSPVLQPFRGRSGDDDGLDLYEHSSRNWWCQSDRSQLQNDVRREFFDAAVGVRWRLSEVFESEGYAWQQGSSERREWLLAHHPALQLVDWDEIASLSTISAAPRALADRAVAWSRSRTFWERMLGEDALLAETLHLAVRATRYGCQRDGGYGPSSRAAWIELHQKFPQSEWTKKTPYWFDCQHFSASLHVDDCRSQWQIRFGN